MCIETEGDWRWSEPFDIDTVGVFSRTIHHRLHSATLFIEIKQLSGMQKQVVNVEIIFVILGILHSDTLYRYHVLIVGSSHNLSF